jgi:hypothetical protein
MGPGTPATLVVKSYVTDTCGEAVVVRLVEMLPPPPAMVKFVSVDASSWNVPGPINPLKPVVIGAKVRDRLERVAEYDKAPPGLQSSLVNYS